MTASTKGAARAQAERTGALCNGGAGRRQRAVVAVVKHAALVEWLAVATAAATVVVGIGLVVDDRKSIA